MAKKKFLERISDALGLYDPDDPNRMFEEEEDDEEAEEEEVEEKPAKRGFPKAVRPTPIPVTKDEPVPVPVEKEAKEKKPGFLSRVRKGRKQNRTIQMKTTTEVRVVVIEPTSFDDSQKVADFLRNDQPVVVNFETTEQTVRKRMTDFISGTIYALNGTIRTIGPNILVCAPRNVDIDAEAEVYGGERRGSSWPKN
ncbi:MAG: cell division protein SepF [Succiniclasticum sp.]|jgi:cell division inhibitor SepF